MGTPNKMCIFYASSVVRETLGSRCLRSKSFWLDRHRASSEVRRLALGHVDTLKAKIEELSGMVQTLEHLASHCHGDERPDCPILDDLGGAIS